MLLGEEKKLRNKIIQILKELDISLMDKNTNPVHFKMNDNPGNVYFHRLKTSPNHFLISIVYSFGISEVINRALLLSAINYVNAFTTLGKTTLTKENRRDYEASFYITVSELNTSILALYLKRGLLLAKFFDHALYDVQRGEITSLEEFKETLKKEDFSLSSLTETSPFGDLCLDDSYHGFKRYLEKEKHFYKDTNGHIFIEFEAKKDELTNYSEITFDSSKRMMKVSNYIFAMTPHRNLNLMLEALCYLNDHYFSVNQYYFDEEKGILSSIYTFYLPDDLSIYPDSFYFVAAHVPAGDIAYLFHLNYARIGIYQNLEEWKKDFEKIKDK